MKKGISMLLEADLMTKFAKHCEENGFSISKRLRLLILKDSENKLTIEK